MNLSLQNKGLPPLGKYSGDKLNCESKIIRYFDLPVRSRHVMLIHKILLRMIKT
jgi:hypothetical protein